jgi:diguanylate cyclase (GGDEF)-like protein
MPILRIDPVFAEVRLARSLWLIRAFLLVGIIATPLFHYWDHFIDLQPPAESLWLRLGFSLLSALVLGLTYVERLRRWLFFAIPLTQWCGVLVVSVLLSQLDQGFLYGLPGLMLSGMAMMAFAPLFDLYLLSCLAYVVLPNLLMWLTGTPASTVINTNIFLLAMFALQLGFGWLLYRSSRNEFDLERRLSYLASHDELSGLNNRSRFFELGRQEIARCRRYPKPLCCALLDIDRFKQVNDSYGHHAGDMVIRKVAQIMDGLMREVDIIGRLGGEEFGALLIETDLAKAHEVVERVRSTVEAARLVLPTGEELQVTVSIGLAAYQDETDLDALLQRADAAMYAAKHAGRNRVVVAQAGALALR